MHPSLCPDIYSYFLVDGQWSSWTPVEGSDGECSVTCGQGHLKESRTCEYDTKEGECRRDPCGPDETEEQMQTCQDQVCPGN